MSAVLRRGLTEKQLKYRLLLFFLALALPAMLLIYRAYGQVKWEVFHQYRVLAEVLSARIDAELIRLIDTEEARSFTDYGFLIVSGRPGSNYLERSPLSGFPADSKIPGLVGYFQVDSEGAFGSPVLPRRDTAHGNYGVSNAELRARQALSNEIQAILSRPVTRQIEQRADKDEAETVSEATAEAPALFAAAPKANVLEATEPANVFDRLSQAVEGPSERQVLSKYGRVADLKLDSRLEKKSREQAKREYRPSLSLSAGGKRASRKEQVAVYEAPPADEEMLFADDALDSRAATPEGTSVSEIAAARVIDSPGTRVRLFESEIDPMSFEVLDETYFVLYRNVWREGERIIQGAVIRRAPFIREMIEAAYENAAVSAMSNLVTAYQGEVLAAFARHAREYLPRNGELAAELLYRVRLSSPLSDLELIYSVTELPLGPSIRFLAWMGLALLVVLTGGCYAMYRFGVGQMALYRQQQDFVSAVSHELKTPLTSIRMYSEMLKKGWADEDKKAGYYAFIHDESERLSRLIGNVLQLARMTRGKVGIDLREIGVDALLDTVDPKLASQVQSGGFELQRNYAENALEASVTLDGDAFTQILINLVDNAIKFSSGNGQKLIDFACIRQSDDRIRFTVRDYGPGIERDQMRKIFELFYRSENELTRETVGTGIGLALVHQLTLAMNGRVDVINRDPGAEFSLTFPIAIAGSE